MKNHRTFTNVISGSVFLLLTVTSPSQAQSLLVPDESLPVNSSVISESNTSTIIEGTRAGQNLFHSFESFNVGEGKIVIFNSPSADIQHIFARITGGSPSEILGTLSTAGLSKPDLFLLNPNGIIFGRNSRLDVGGSFVASTASAIKFADGSQFSAIDSQAKPLLTISVPIGLQFAGNEGSIINQSRFTPSDRPAAISIPIGLRVPRGKTLALVGGEMTLSGGVMGAPEGRIELSSVAGTSLISIKPVEKGWSLGREQIQSFKDIRLLDEAILGASGNGGGEIQIQGRNVILNNGSQIVAINNGSEPGGNLTVFASDSVELNGTLSNSILETSLSTTAIASGKAGDITINTRKLVVRDASISTQTRGRNIRLATGLGGGNLIVNASESVELANGFLSTDTSNAATAGDLRISTKNLTIRDGALVSVSSEGTGNAGDLEVAAGSIRLENGGKLTATSASGEGGNIRLNQLDLLLLRDNSEISTDATGGTGNGGNITIDTDTLAIVNNSSITANAVEGRGGNIRITTQALFVSPDSSINADSERGINGVVEIRRPDVDPTAELVILPANVVNVSELVTQGCAADGSNLAHGQGQFTIAGRGGLPPTPAEATRSDTPLVDLGTSIQSQEQLTTTTIHSNSTSIKSTPPLVEANGWEIGDKGEVILTASSPNTPDIPWLTPTSCHRS